MDTSVCVWESACVYEFILFTLPIRNWGRREKETDNE